MRFFMSHSRSPDASRSLSVLRVSWRFFIQSNQDVDLSYIAIIAFRGHQVSTSTVPERRVSLPTGKRRASATRVLFFGSRRTLDYAQACTTGSRVNRRTAHSLTIQRTSALPRLVESPMGLTIR
jgi:hypothetical protein